MYPARARTRAARFEVQHTNHKATASFISPITLAWGDYEYVCTSFPWMGSYSFARLPTSIKFVLPICTLGWRKLVHIPMAGVKRLAQEHSTIFDQYSNRAIHSGV